jgi:hypothetical protein
MHCPRPRIDPGRTTHTLILVPATLIGLVVKKDFCIGRSSRCEVHALIEVDALIGVADVKFMR